MLNTISQLSQRIAQLRQREMLSQRAFSEKLGLSSASISQIENGKRKPPAELLVSIVNTFPNVNDVWLLRGTGDMYTVEGELKSLAPPENEQRWPSLAEDADMRAAEVVKRLDLGSMAQLAKGSTHRLAYRTLRLLELEPKGLTGRELLAQMKNDSNESIEIESLVHELAILTHKGLIQSSTADTADETYFLSKSQRLLKTRSSDERNNEFLLEAFQLMTDKILPKVKDKQAGFFISTLHLPKAVAERLGKETFDKVKPQWLEASHDNGSGDTEVSVILGVGWQP